LTVPAVAVVTAVLQAALLVLVAAVLVALAPAVLQERLILAVVAVAVKVAGIAAVQAAPA
jgi:hypothetical protein